MKIEIRALPASVSPSPNNGSLTVKGLVNGAGSVSEILMNPSNGKQFKETIAPGVFQNAINNAPDGIDFLAQHDKNQILSSTVNNSLSIQETEQGLEMSANISDTTWGRDTFELIKDGIIKGMSFGMRVLDDVWTMGTDNIPMRTINNIELFEVSAVRNPAYKSSDIEPRGMDLITEVKIPDNLLEERSQDMAKEEEEKKSVETTTTTTKAPAKEDEKAPAKKEPAKEEEKSAKKASETKEEKAKAPAKHEEKKSKPADKKSEAREDDDEDRDDDMDEDRSKQENDSAELRSLISELSSTVSALATKVNALSEVEEKRSKLMSEKEVEIRDFFVK